MQIVNARDLGLVVRERRRRLGKTQAQLATAAAVSRRWLSDLERGKPTAEFGLVLRTLAALGLALFAEPDEVPPGAVDLDKHLERYLAGQALLPPEDDS